jgi:hypothetical protein
MKAITTAVLAVAALGLAVAIVVSATGGTTVAAPAAPTPAAPSTSDASQPAGQQQPEAGPAATSSPTGAATSTTEVEAPAVVASPPVADPAETSEDPPAQDDGGVEVTVRPEGSMPLADARALTERVWGELEADLADSGQRTWSAWKLLSARVETAGADAEPTVRLTWIGTRAVDGSDDVMLTTWPWTTPGQ